MTLEKYLNLSNQKLLHKPVDIHEMIMGIVKTCPLLSM